jgi:hypothetical protein
MLVKSNQKSRESGFFAVCNSAFFDNDGVRLIQVGAAMS